MLGNIPLLVDVLKSLKLKSGKTWQNCTKFRIWNQYKSSMGFATCQCEWSHVAFAYVVFKRLQHLRCSWSTAAADSTYGSLWVCLKLEAKHPTAMAIWIIWWLMMKLYLEFFFHFYRGLNHPLFTGFSITNHRGIPIFRIVLCQDTRWASSILARGSSTICLCHKNVCSRIRVKNMSRIGYPHFNHTKILDG